MTCIKRLVVDNFQSHEHTAVEFGTGLNVVVGPSDCGKSALVRALRWVLYNEPRGANFIRVGAKVCQVRIELDEGTVVTRLRSRSGKNQYLLKRPGENELVFEGFGSEIPLEIIQATGVRKIFIDERSKAELNLGPQLEGPFLLAENGAVRAKVIGQLGGVHILDWAQRSVHTELRRLREEEKRDQDELLQVAASLRSYEHLPDLEERITQLGELVSRAAEVTEKIAELSALQWECEENKAAITKVEQVLAALAQLKQGEQKYQQLVELSEGFLNLFNLNTEINQVNRQLEKASVVITGTGQVSDMDEYLQRISPLFQEWRDFHQIGQDLGQIARYVRNILFIAERTKELGKVEGHLVNIEEAEHRLNVYRDLWKEWQDHEKSYRGACLAAEHYQREIDQHLRDFRKLLLKLGKCPVCFGELDVDAVNRVLDEYR